MYARARVVRVLKKVAAHVGRHLQNSIRGRRHVRHRDARVSSHPIRPRVILVRTSRDGPDDVRAVTLLVRGRAPGGDVAVHDELVRVAEVAVVTIRAGVSAAHNLPVAVNPRVPKRRLRGDPGEKAPLHHVPASLVQPTTRSRRPGESVAAAVPQRSKRAGRLARRHPMRGSVRRQPSHSLRNLLRANADEHARHTLDGSFRIRRRFTVLDAPARPRGDGSRPRALILRGDHDARGEFARERRRQRRRHSARASLGVGDDAGQRNFQERAIVGVEGGDGASSRAEASRRGFGFDVRHLGGARGS